jgi:putative oxidoreductase
MQALYNDPSWLVTLGRWLIVVFFLAVGIRNCLKPQVDDHLHRLTIFHAPFPLYTFWIGQTLEFVGCALVLLNWHPAVGVGCLIVFTVVASALLLRFWEVGDPFKKMIMRNAMLANTAIVGGLLLLLQNAR